VYVGVNARKKVIERVEVLVVVLRALYAGELRGVYFVVYILN
jgi:hypothetical protein